MGTSRKKPKDFSELANQIYESTGLITSDPLLYERIIQEASSKRPLLIVGAEGTGKHLIAKSIVALSSRSRKKMREIDCLDCDCASEEDIARFLGIGPTSRRTPSVKKPKSSSSGSKVGFIEDVHLLSKTVQKVLASFLKNLPVKQKANDKKSNSVRRVFLSTTDANWKSNLQAGLVQLISSPVISTSTLSKQRHIIPWLIRDFLEGSTIKKLDAHFLLYCLSSTWERNIGELRKLCEAAIETANAGRPDLVKSLFGLYNEATKTPRVLTAYFSKNPPKTEGNYLESSLAEFIKPTSKPPELIRYMSFLRDYRQSSSMVDEMEDELFRLKELIKFDPNDLIPPHEVVGKGTYRIKAALDNRMDKLTSDVIQFLEEWTPPFGDVSDLASGEQLKLREEGSRKSDLPLEETDQSMIFFDQDSKIVFGDTNYIFRSSSVYYAIRYIAIRMKIGDYWPHKRTILIEANVDERTVDTQSLKKWVVLRGGDPKRFAERFLINDRKGGCSIDYDPDLIEIRGYESCDRPKGRRRR